jgi:hypothetical protein
MRTFRKCYDNIKMYTKVIRCENATWTHLSQYRAQLRALAKTTMNFRISMQAAIPFTVE